MAHPVITVLTQALGLARRYLALRVALWRVETRKRVEKLALGLILMATALILVVIAVVFMLFALVEILQTLAGFSAAAAFAVVGAAVLALAIMLAFWGRHLLRRGVNPVDPQP